jgi:hypothetical protein
MSGSYAIWAEQRPGHLSKLMDTTLCAEYKFCRCYIDDVIIFSKSFDEHVVHLRAVFAQL